MKIKIFWKKNCPNCPDAKKIGEIIKDEIKVQYCNVNTVDGLSEACMLNVMSTPSIVLVDDKGNEIEAWRGMVPKIEYIREKISK